MTTEGVMLRDGNCAANSDLSGKQFYAVKLVSAMTVDLASTGGEAISGIQQGSAKQGQAVDYAFDGITKAHLGSGGATAGNLLQTEASTGKLIVKTSTNVVVAIAMETGNADELIRVRLVPTAG